MEITLEQIIAAFNSSGWSKDRLAKECGDSRGYVTNVLNGKRKATSAVLTRMAQALGLLPSEVDYRSVIPVSVRFTQNEWANICSAFPNANHEQIEQKVRDYLLAECATLNLPEKQRSDSPLRSYGEDEALDPFA